jgi:hypothetical protein
MDERETMDEYEQADAPDEFSGPEPTTHPSHNWTKRTTKGNRAAQQKRYRARHASHVRERNRKYMACRRAEGSQV